MQDEVKKIIGNRIRDLRIKNGYEQSDVAEKLDYKSDTTISKWESGSSLPTGKKLVGLALLFNTSTDYILFGIEPKKDTTPTQPPSELVTAITDKVVQLTTSRQENVLGYATDQLERQQKEEAIIEDTIISLDDYRERVDRTVKGKVSAGTGYWQEDDYDISVSFYADDIPDDDDYDSIAIVVGHSMEPKIKNGDFLFIKFTPDVDLNTIGIFQVNGENYVKKRKDNYLQSLNPDCDDIHLTEDDHVRTIGEVVEVYRER